MKDMCRSPARNPSFTLKQRDSSIKGVPQRSRHSLLVILVSLEIVYEAGEQVDLRQVEQGVVDIDPLFIKLKRKVLHLFSAFFMLSNLEEFVGIFGSDLFRLEELQAVAAEENVSEPVHLCRAIFGEYFHHRFNRNQAHDSMKCH